MTASAPLPAHLAPITVEIPATWSDEQALAVQEARRAPRPCAAQSVLDGHEHGAILITDGRRRHHPSVRGETQSFGRGRAFSSSFMSFRSPLVNQESLLLATLRG